MVYGNANCVIPFVDCKHSTGKKSRNLWILYKLNCIKVKLLNSTYENRSICIVDTAFIGDIENKILPPKTNSELQESKTVTEGEELNSKENVEETSLGVEVGLKACEKDANTVSSVSQNIETFY